MRNLRIIAGSLALLAMVGCGTVTIRDKGEGKLSNQPTYQASENFFLWGLVGHRHIDVKQICQGKPAHQMQATYTFVNVLLYGVTAGIYAPRSVKVWCAASAGKG